MALGCETKQPPVKSPLCCEIISQPQEAAVKMPLCCEIILQPHAPSAKPPLGTRVPFHSLLPQFRGSEMVVKFPKHKKSNFRSRSPISQGVSQPEALFRRVFRSCETPLQHMSAISQHSTLIRSYEMGYENAPPLPNRPFSAKIKTTLGIHFLNLINSRFC